MYMGGWIKNKGVDKRSVLRDQWIKTNKQTKTQKKAEGQASRYIFLFGARGWRVEKG